jgi:Straboviridae DNA replication helicase
MADRLSISLQENIVTMLAYSDEHGKLVANLIDPNLFEGELRVIAERAQNYWHQHGQAPKGHTADLVSEIIEDPTNKKAQTYRRILISMLQLSEQINTKYVLEQLKSFTRTQRLKAAILRSAEQLEAKQEMGVQEVEEIWNDILHSRDLTFDPGTYLLDYGSMLEYLRRRDVEFTMGIPQLDQRHFVPMRSAVMLILGPTGKGKSWALVHVGKQALMQRKKVVHITLELGMEETKQRYYQSIFAIPKREAQELSRTTLKFDRFGKFDGFGSSQIKADFAFDSDLITDELETRVMHFGSRFGNLLIKKFPMRSLTINGLRGYLDNIEITEKFIPDIMILDYIGVMKTDSRNPRISLGHVFEEFKGICDERHIAGVTAQQVSKIGARADFVRMTHVAEDWSLTNTADQVLTYSCTDTEERYGLARLYVDKARSEESKFGILITQNYSTGQFCLESAALEQRYFDYLSDLKQESDDVEADDSRDDQ